jgi:2-polyprenyl-6-methoxyphenol hydroxylase-like FAD-dependent oxidoreductase
MEAQGEGWTIHFGDGSSAYADLVVAADGAQSRLRKYITAITPVYSGLTVLEGNIYHAAENAPKLHAMVKGGKLFAMDGTESIILSAKGDGSLSFYTGSREAEDWVLQSGIDFNDREQLRAWFRERFKNWSPVWLELFGSADSYFVPRPMYHYEGVQQWSPLSNLTMIGDAAHRMPPYAGEGVNMAMLDALELSEALCNPGYNDLQAVIGAFETEMCKRAAEVTAVTLEQMESMHSPGGAERLVAMFSEHE